jgi:hypothetical protein
LGIIENGALTQVKVFGEIRVSATHTILMFFNQTGNSNSRVEGYLGKWNLDEAVYKY